MSYVSDHLAWQ